VIFREIERATGSRSNLAAMAAKGTIEISDAPERNRYELSVDGETVGFTEYHKRPGLISFVHTEIDESVQGRGLGDTLIRFALEDARKRDLAVLPFCPFVKAFIERHREFEALVPPANCGSTAQLRVERPSSACESQSR
jgi:predicted GNAT family acetyltransferase